MRIKKLINRLFKRENPYHKRITKLMDELSPEELELVKERIVKLKREMGA